MIRHSRILLAFLTLAAILLPTDAAQAVDGGPKKLKLGKVELKQNGFGYRKKGLITLYEGSLYLLETSHDADAILAAEQPMAIRIQIKSGFVSQDNLMAALIEGFETSTGNDSQAIAEQIAQFRDCFSDPIKKNDVFVLSYIPEAGVLVHKNGNQKGIIPGTAFKKALFGIWLANPSVDNSLRSAMLGIERR